MNILLTSVGRRTYLVKYFKKELSEGLVHVANSTELAPAFLAGDKCVVTPLIYDEEYVPFLIEYCRNNSISAIISLFDVDLPILSKNRKKFEEIGVRLVVSSEKVIETCNDKWKTYLFLKENGFPTIPTYLSADEAMSALDNDEIDFPLIVKPRWGMGSLGIYEVWTKEELEICIGMTKRKIHNSYLCYEAEQDRENDCIIQRKIVGQEYGLDIINNLDEEYCNTVIKKKVAMRSGETDCAITVEDKRIRSLGENISEKLKHIGNLDVDVIMDNEGMLYVLEMNARFGGGYPFSHMAGVNLPKAIIDWCSGKETDKDNFAYKYPIRAHKVIDMTII